MVVYIENTEKSFIKIDYEMKEFRNEHGKITPEFALEILSKTNHKGNIRFLIDKINLLPEDERKQFGEFVLQAIDCRLHHDSIHGKLRKLADECGVVEEFDALDKNVKLYMPEDCKCIIVNDDNIGKFSSFKDDCVTIFDVKKKIEALEFENTDMSKVKFVSLCYPSRGLYTSYKFCRNFSENVIRQGCLGSDFINCDFAGKDSLYLSSSNVKIENAKNLPDYCRFIGEVYSPLFVSSRCYLMNNDFEGVDKLEVHGYGELRCVQMQNMSGRIALSDIRDAVFIECDLSSADELVVGENCSFLGGRVKFPKKTKFSKGCKVELEKCDFSKVEELIFDDVEELVCRDAVTLPKKIDLSKIKKVNIDDLDISGVEEIVFSDILQKNRVLKNCNYNGKVSYTSFLGMGIGGREK